MGLFSKWKEAYMSFDCNDFIKCCNILDEKGINFRTQVINNGIHIGFNTRLGGATSFGRDALSSYSSYLIRTLKEDVDKAKYYLGRM